MHRDGATGNFLGEGIVVAVDSGKAMVRGNQVLFTLAFALAADGTSEGIGILTVTNAAIRIEGNQVMGWFRGIEGRGAAIVSKNQVWQNQIGIFASGGSVVGNVATANGRGIQATGSAQVTSNACTPTRTGSTSTVRLAASLRKTTCSPATLSVVSRLFKPRA